MPKKAASKPKTIYHGTSEEIAKMSLVFGLNIYEVPEMDCGRKRILPGSSNEGIVLTSCYSGFMANETSSIKDKWGIIEIDLNQLNPSSFYPHEYFLLEKSKKKSSTLNEFLENSKKCRSKIKSNQKSWQDSLKNLGFIVCGQNIPAKAILKVVVFDWKTNWMITREALNVNPSSSQHALQKERQELVNRWLMCDLVESKDWCDGYDNMPVKERETIANHMFNKSGLDIYYSK